MSTKQTASQGLNYQEAGVDINKAKRFVSLIQEATKNTERRGVTNTIGSFAALFKIPPGYRDPLLVSSTDGVGTKLALATALDRHDTIGIDLVAMCVNDVLCHGAEPAFFLDYYAMGQLHIEQSRQIIKGIIKGCRLANAALVGGETAEMPGFYDEKKYDLAGFCVGFVEQSRLIDGSAVKVGDRVIGLASSGPHANGYSLIRRVMEITGSRYCDFIENDKTLGEILLAPTRIYVKSILNLLSTVTVNGIAHITGGGLIENIPRCLPSHTQAILMSDRWPCPPIFQWLQTQGNIDLKEMYRSFNMGIGMVVIVPPGVVEATLNCLEAAGERAWIIGSVESSDARPTVVIK